MIKFNFEKQFGKGTDPWYAKAERWAKKQKFPISFLALGFIAWLKEKWIDVKVANTMREIDIYNPHHWQSIQMMFQRNARKGQIEKNATLPSDAINNALMEFNNGSNDPTKSEELLQLPSDRDQPSG